MKKFISFTVFLLIVTVSMAQQSIDDVYVNTSVLPQNSITLNSAQSMAPSTDYLIVVDDKVSTLQEFQQIQSSDILETSFSSTSMVYGNRGANGVIIIQTKRGGFQSPLASIQQ